MGFFFNQVGTNTIPNEYWAKSMKVWKAYFQFWLRRFFETLLPYEVNCNGILLVIFSYFMNCLSEYMSVIHSLSQQFLWFFVSSALVRKQQCKTILSTLTKSCSNKKPFFASTYLHNMCSISMHTAQFPGRLFSPCDIWKKLPQNHLIAFFILYQY